MNAQNRFQFLGEDNLDEISAWLRQNLNGKRLAILADDNTAEACLPILDSLDDDQITNAELIVVPKGEESKSLEIAEGVCENLLEQNYDRNTLLLNLGGGVVTDLGGFVASIYKRGIQFVNIPTTLLGMVDAAVGGKTGVNLGYSKNQIGRFAQAEQVFISPVFLESLPSNEKISGFAEMLKHALIADRKHWDHLLQKSYNKLSLEDIRTSVLIKEKICALDPFEKADRKKLNLGHNFGHAIEAWFLEKDKQIRHGDCVAEGLVIESFAAEAKVGLNPNLAAEIRAGIRKFFPKMDLTSKDLKALLKYLGQDKKNKSGSMRFSLLKDFALVQFDVELSMQEIEQSFARYLEEK